MRARTSLPFTTVSTRLTLYGGPDAVIAEPSFWLFTCEPATAKRGVGYQFNKAKRSFHKTHHDQPVYRLVVPPREAFCTLQAAGLCCKPSASRRDYDWIQ